MKSQKKVKLLIGLAIFVAVALLGVTVFQLTYIIRTNNRIEKQQQIIRDLEEELEYNNKQPDSDYEVIS